MSEYYIFADKVQLERKVDNILKHRETDVSRNKSYRDVADGEYALMINLYERHLYKRVRNIWVIHEEGSLTDHATCTADELTIVHKTFEDVIRCRSSSQIPKF